MQSGFNPVFFIRHIVYILISKYVVFTYIILIDVSFNLLLFLNGMSHIKIIISGLSSRLPLLVYNLYVVKGLYKTCFIFVFLSPIFINLTLYNIKDNYDIYLLKWFLMYLPTILLYCFGCTVDISNYLANCTTYIYNNVLKNNGFSINLNHVFIHVDGNTVCDYT